MTVTMDRAGAVAAAGDTTAGVDPARLELCLAVLAEVERLPVEHPDAVRVRRATAALYKTAKEQRRRERRDAILAADAAVTAATATGAPDRLDDETRGVPLSTRAGAPIAGFLRQARGCYICKQRYHQVDAFYHQLCPPCAELNHSRRDARTDLTGRRALLTGGRAKIGMYIALRLLRDGAHTTITTRFPHDAARRFARSRAAPRRGSAPDRDGERRAPFRRASGRPAASGAPAFPAAPPQRGPPPAAPARARPPR